MKILPQQIALLNLFFLNTLELQQRIKNELEENPFLDATEEKTDEECNAKMAKDAIRDFESSEENMYDDYPDYKSDYQNYFDSESSVNSPIVNVTTFKEDAKQQLHMLNINKNDMAIAEYLIDMLNQQGLIDKPLDEIEDSMCFHFQKVVEKESILRGLNIIQSLDPIGIGTCSIKECLLLQLSNMNTQKPGVGCAITLLKDHYDDLVCRQFDKLHRILKIDDEEMKEVLGLIGSLKFYPVNELSQYDQKQTIIPDFIITESGNKMQVSLYSSKAGSVFVNQSLYNQLADNISTKDKTASQYVKNKLTSAQWFVDSVKTREDTMLRIMQCIVTLQHEYFMHGDIKYLKPMVLRNISENTGLDISTISRITSNKYAETPFGLIYLKKLFSEGISDKNGEVISNKVIQSVIGDAIDSENKKHPYKDRELVNLLSAKGYKIARRTVSKYREQMKLPIAQIRAIWA